MSIEDYLKHTHISLFLILPFRLQETLWRWMRGTLFTHFVEWIERETSSSKAKRPHEVSYSSITICVHTCIDNLSLKCCCLFRQVGLISMIYFCINTIITHSENLQKKGIYQWIEKCFSIGFLMNSIRWKSRLCDFFVELDKFVSTFFWEIDSIFFLVHGVGHTRMAGFLFLKVHFQCLCSNEGFRRTFSIPFAFNYINSRRSKRAFEVKNRFHMRMLWITTKTWYLTEFRSFVD